MGLVEITIQGERQSLSLSEARALQRELPGAIHLAEHSATVTPPQLTYGHLTRASMYEYFAQLHDSDIAARNVASKLLANLVRAAAGYRQMDRIEFDIIHAECGNHVSMSDCEGRNHSAEHRYRKHQEYFIEVQSLKCYAEVFTSSHRRNVGPHMRRNLMLLTQQL